MRALKPLLVGFAVIALDVASKLYVHNNLPLMNGPFPYGGIPLFQNFFGIEGSIVHATNTGAAWGMMGEYPQLLFVGRLILVALLFFFLLFGKRPSSTTIPLTMVIAGAIGNLIDTFSFGHVVDMFLFVFWGYHYPVFNVADSSIFLGVVALIFSSRKHETSS